MSRTIILLSIACTIVLIIILFFQPTPESALPKSQSISLSKTVPAEAVEFTDVSMDLKVTGAHQQTSAHLSSLSETLGGGICAIDFNKDGWIDLFLVGGSGHNRHYGKKAWWHKTTGNRLLLNRQGHHFEDVTEDAGLQVRMWGMACSVADLDNDSFQDLIVTGVGANAIFKNNGDSTFSDVTKKSGVLNAHWSNGASLGDFNGDGLLDIYVSNYVLYERGARTFERTSGFRTTTKVDFDQTLYDPEPNQLYLNRGSFQFEDVTSRVDVSNSLGRSLGAKWIDLNNDNWLDLLVINEHNSPNQIFINHFGKSFSLGDDRYASLEIAGAHDVIIKDFYNDGQPEVFMSRGMSRAPLLLTYSSEQQRYTDTAWARGLAQTRLLPFTGWGSIASDFNNDGLLDLYIANGSIMPDIDSHYVAQAQANSLFVNTGNGQFAYQTPTVDKQHSYSSRGAIAVDLDNDGQLEVVVANNNDSLQIFKNKNRSNNNWIGLDLRPSHKDAEIYGAIVTIETDNLTQRRTLQPAQNFLSQGDMRFHFGLGKSDKVNSLHITWLDGSSSVFNDISANAYYVINIATNTLVAQQYQVGSNAHFNGALTTYGDNALVSLSKIMLMAPAEKQTLDDIGLIWRYGSTAVRVAMLDNFSAHWSPRYLPIVLKGLANETAQIRIKAVELLKNAELEASMVWLLPLLNDEDPEVQCATAETFRFFFDEEEAVTHRKKLAITPLIRLLESGVPQARVCAANALAAAENKRAILPLIEQATQHSAVEVKSSAIRALGLIRDTSALDTLHNLLRDATSKAPVTASVLIALSRLNDPSLDALIDGVFGAKNDIQADQHPIKRNPDYLYDMLTAIFSIEDGVVLSKPKLERRLALVIAQNLGKLLIAGPDNDRSIIAALRAIRAGKVGALEKTVMSFIRVANDETRIEALLALASINGPSARKQFESQLLRESPSVINTLLDPVGHEGYRFSSQFILQLAQMTAKPSVKQPVLFQKMLAILSNIPYQSASDLLDALLSEHLDDSQIASLLNACKKAPLSPSHVNQTLLSHSSPQIRLQAYHCFLHDDRKYKTQNSSLKRSLMTHTVLKAVTGDSSLDAHSKSALLIKAAELDAVIAGSLLIKKNQTIPVDLLPSAIHALAKHGLVLPVKEFLWDLLSNQRHPIEIRLQSAELLANLDYDRVINYLYQLAKSND